MSDLAAFLAVAAVVMRNTLCGGRRSGIFELSFCSLTLAWLTAYAIAVETAGDMFGRSGIRRSLEAMTGAVLVALGQRLALERR